MPVSSNEDLSALYGINSLVSAEDGRHYGRSKERVESMGGDTVRVVGIRERIRHFTWLWFISTMSTGGLAILLAETPHRFRGKSPLRLYTIGVVVFIFDLAVFITLCLLMATRAIIDPRHFLKSFVNPAEMFCFGAFLLSIATILGCIQVYAIRGEQGTRGPAWPWLVDAIHILYWIYAGCALCDAILQYWIFMTRLPTRPLPIHSGWFLSGYSVMLTGTIAALIAPTQPPERKIPIIVSCILWQGLGWTYAFILIVIYLLRLFESGLPPPSTRPGMFIPVCAPAYTIVALMGISHSLPRDYGYFASHPPAIDMLQAVALFVSIFLWLFGFWLFSVALLSCIVGARRMGFSLSWWVAIFPNVGYTLATVQIGMDLESEPILWVASVMTAILVAVWLFTWVACVHAVVTRRIMWPGKDEDKDV